MKDKEPILYRHSTQAGVHLANMDSRLRGNDACEEMTGVDENNGGLFSYVAQPENNLTHVQMLRCVAY